MAPLDLDARLSPVWATMTDAAPLRAQCCRPTAPRSPTRRVTDSTDVRVLPSFYPAAVSPRYATSMRESPPLWHRWSHPRCPRVQSAVRPTSVGDIDDLGHPIVMSVVLISQPKDEVSECR
jgi:hypothetical protein